MWGRDGAWRSGDGAAILQSYLQPSPDLTPFCYFAAPEFKQKEECTVRGRNLIQISIQEDPWNLPSSIRTLVDNIQRYVEGQWFERVSPMSVAFGSECRLWCCLEWA